MKNEIFWLVASVVIGLNAFMAQAIDPCGIQVVEAGSGWPVPLVELRTVHQVRFVSDNAGMIAFDLPELMGRETWFDVIADGYDVAADGFGMRGVRLTPESGRTLRVEVRRTGIARRLGRLTGAGLFAESQKLGLEGDWSESGELGCDSVQLAEHDGRLFWAWGDTLLSRYPLGIFHMTAATTANPPITSFEPPVRLKFDPFTDSKGLPRGVAQMPGSGPTWLSGFASVPDATGTMHLVAAYGKIKAPLAVYEKGLCVWNGETENFDRLRVVWTKTESMPEPPPVPDGHPATWTDKQGRTWLLFGDPLPRLRCPATFEDWQDSRTWEVLEPQAELVSADDGSPVRPHSGSIAWNAFRRRWVVVFMQSFGKPSAFGEIWYAEADSPLGPWGQAVKVLSHENYTFYNPHLHPECASADSPVLLFEGTYTATFADRPMPTPRYNYTQILYRLDLDDPALSPAQSDRKP